MFLFGWHRGLLLAGMMLLAVSVALANEPPRPGEIDKYKADGTWQQRLSNAYELGNHLPAPGLAAYTNWKVEQLVRQAAGLPGLDTPPPDHQGGLPTSGSPKILVMLVDFPADPNDPNDPNDPVCPGYLHYPNQTQADVYDKCFQDGISSEYPYESILNYFERASYNTLHIQGNVLGWYTAQHSRCYYSDLAVAHSDAYAREALIMEAMDYFNSPAGGSHDFTQYDNDGNGTLDTVYLKYTGPDTGWSSLWWAYKTGWYANPSYTVDGKSVDTYVWGWIANPEGGNYDVHTELHETGHALGLPDYYDYDENVGPDGGLGGLDMQHDNVGDWNCYSKFMVDWLTPTTIVAGSQTLTLNPSGTSQDCALIMPGVTPGDSFAEFFMVQYRKASAGNDPASYPTGFAIWHVDATLNAAGTNWLYDNSYTAHKQLRRMEADGLEEIETGDGHADAADFYVPPTVFGPTTFPNSNDYTGTPTTVRVDQLTAPSATMSGRFGFFGAQPAGAALVAEGCTPGNGVIDPAEAVTVSFALHNDGPAMTNLVATLLPTGGVVAPSGPQSYGALAMGATAAQSFSFTAGGTCGGTVTATLALQDGANMFAPVTYTFTLGALRMSQNFDGVTAPALPAGWVATRPVGTGPLWVTTTSAAQTTPNAVFAAEPSTVSDNRLDSLPIMIGSAGAQLAFWHKYDTQWALDGGVLEISINGGAFADIVTAGGSFVANGYDDPLQSTSNPLGYGRSVWTGTAANFIETVVNLPAGVVGNTVVFRWRFGTNSSVAGNGWWVDSVRILNDPVCCETANTGACCLPDGSCADVTEAPCIETGGTWHAGTTCATYECPQACCYGYPYACDDMTSAECAALGGSFHAGFVCATYTCVPPYCTASSSSCSYANIGRVVVGTIDNDTTCTPGGYADYTALSTNMLVGTGYPVTVTDGPPAYVGDQCGIWVDWNHNYVFTDPGEQVTVTYAGGGVFHATITPPTGSPTGATRMRVRIKYTGTLGPCGNESYGETEDYTVNVVGAQGACCFADGTCTLTTQAACSGIWHGEWTSCQPNNCPQPPVGACCLLDGNCLPTTQANCGGIWHGEWTSCEPNNCPQPQGACCQDNGDCSVTRQAACSGIWHGEWTSCEPNNCPQPPVGACCLLDGNCLPTTQANCGGIWHGEWTSCEPNNCPQPQGACCQDNGDCSVTTQAACSGIWHGEWTSCEPNNCPQPQGACCQDNGDCSATTQAACSGIWHGEWTSCEPNNCPQPQGACCQDNGDCTVTTQAACAGIWHGEWTSCEPNNCPQPEPGACCMPGGYCTEVLAIACQSAGGQFHGVGAVCVPCMCATCVGDADCNGIIDFDDINPWIRALSTNEACNLDNADCNCDGVIDFADINPFVALISSGECPTP